MGANDSALIVGGVSGCGKSTVALAVARAQGIKFIDSDDLHPFENVEWMASGRPLTDEQRWPWLQRIVEEIDANTGPIVVACSALKREYREALRQASRPTSFVELSGSREVLESRLRARKDHFMPADLLDSQIATLEPLEQDELEGDGLRLDITLPLAEKVKRIVDWWNPTSLHSGTEADNGFRR